MYGHWDHADGYGFQPDSVFYVDGYFKLQQQEGKYMTPGLPGDSDGVGVEDSNDDILTYFWNVIVLKRWTYIFLVWLISMNLTLILKGLL